MISKYEKIILKEMFNFVGETYTDEYIRDQFWDLRCEWSESDEKKFKDWIINYLKENKKARDCLMRFPSKSKESLQKVADNFIFNYSWKIKVNDDKKDKEWGSFLDD